MEYPLIFIVAECDELEYIVDQRELKELQSRVIDKQDKLLDSNGKTYHFTAGVWVASAENLTLSEFEGLVQKHAESLSFCCVAKLRLNTLMDGFEIVKES